MESSSISSSELTIPFPGSDAVCGDDISSSSDVDWDLDHRQMVAP